MVTVEHPSYSLKQKAFGSWVVMKRSPGENGQVDEEQVSPDFNSSDEAHDFPGSLRRGEILGSRMVPSVDAEELGRLADTLTTAQECFGVWSVLQDPGNSLRRHSNFNSFAHFFRPTIHSQLAATIVALFSLYDRKEHVSLRRYEEAFADPDLAKDYGRAKILWKKVCILRHKFFAHQDLKLSMEKVFALAALEPKEIEELITSSRNLVNSLAVKNGFSRMVEKKARSSPDTEKLLEYIVGLSTQK